MTSYWRNLWQKHTCNSLYVSFSLNIIFYKVCFPGRNQKKHSLLTFPFVLIIILLAIPLAFSLNMLTFMHSHLTCSGYSILGKVASMRCLRDQYFSNCANAKFVKSNVKSLTAIPSKSPKVGILLHVILKVVHLHFWHKDVMLHETVLINKK